MTTDFCDPLPCRAQQITPFEPQACMEQAQYLELRTSRRRSTASSSRLSSVASTSTGGLNTDADRSLDSDYEQHASNLDTEAPGTTGSSNHSEVPTAISAGSDNPVAAPRKRGRPRKHPIVERKKPTHARSRTGCATCRRRKKKCDERKPTCLACEKNNIVCDGYEPLLPWKSSKDKVVIPPLVSPSSSELPPLVNGIENEIDQAFLQYFLNNVSNVLSINDHCNPFHDIIMPMAMSDQGLMHGILYFSSSCLLVQKANRTDRAWEVRQEYHMSMSVRLLQQDLAKISDSTELIIGDTTIAHTLILCLQTIGAADTPAAWRIHIRGLKQILLSNRWTYHDEQLLLLVEEFLLHHESCAAITSLSNPLTQSDGESVKYTSTRLRPHAAESSALIGIHDGLFEFIPRIRALKDLIRNTGDAHKAQWHNDRVIGSAFAIDSDFRTWTCTHPAGSLRHTACRLQRIALWLYLHRTVQPAPSPTFQRAVDEGLRYVALLHDFGETSSQSVILMPLFLLGCNAFEKRQRPHITEAFERLQSWSCMGNIRQARTVIEHLWHLVDTDRMGETWDWESIIAKQGWDFIVS